MYNHKDLELKPVSSVKVGDVVLYKPLPPDYSTLRSIFTTLMSIIITFVTRSRYNHASLVKSVNKSSIYITEAHLETGVVTKLLNPKWYDSIVFMTFSSSMVRDDAAIWWDNQCGSKYDSVAAFLSGVLSFFRVFRKLQLPFDCKNKFFCSNGIALGFNKHSVPISKVHVSQCCPGDIFRFKKHAHRIYRIQ